MEILSISICPGTVTIAEEITSFKSFSTCKQDGIFSLFVRVSSLGLYQWSEAVVRTVTRLWDVRGGHMIRHQVYILVTPRVVVSSQYLCRPRSEGFPSSISTSVVRWLNIFDKLITRLNRNRKCVICTSGADKHLGPHSRIRAQSNLTPGVHRPKPQKYNLIWKDTFGKTDVSPSHVKHKVGIKQNWKKLGFAGIGVGEGCVLGLSCNTGWRWFYSWICGWVSWDGLGVRESFWWEYLKVALGKVWFGVMVMVLRLFLLRCLCGPWNGSKKSYFSDWTFISSMFSMAYSNLMAIGFELRDP